MRFIKIEEVQHMTSKSRTGIYDDIADGKFPRQVRHGSSSFWVEDEIIAWMKEQVAIRDSMPTPPST